MEVATDSEVLRLPEKNDSNGALVGHHKLEPLSNGIDGIKESIKASMISPTGTDETDFTYQHSVCTTVNGDDDILKATAREFLAIHREEIALRDAEITNLQAELSKVLEGVRALDKAGSEPLNGEELNGRAVVTGKGEPLGKPNLTAIYDGLQTIRMQIERQDAENEAMLRELNNWKGFGVQLTNDEPDAS